MAGEKEAYDEWMRLYTCDDTYWKIPSRYVDRSRVGSYEKRLWKFEKKYPECIDDLVTGAPTCYCVLCVTKDDPPDAIERAYQRKMTYSIYPDDMIERAYGILRDKKKRSDYDKILQLFTKVMQSLSATEKREITEEHDSWLRDEEERATGGYLQEHRVSWRALIYRGAPTFYELLGVDRGKLASGAKVKCKNRNLDSRLADEVCDILNNLQLRFEYDFMLDKLDSMLYEDYLEELNDEGKSWGGRDLLYLMMLRYYDYILKYVEIDSEHNDWNDYTEDRTFYDLLSIDAALIPEDKREAERLIRDAYKNKERTPEINLAYSVLKNSRMRDEYDWLLNYGEFVRAMMYAIDTEEASDSELDALMYGADMFLP